LYFCDLARSLGPDQPFWALQALGLGENERIPVRIEENASHYVDVIRKEVQAEGPYFLIGHSFGAFTAFEMARQLLEYGEKVVFLGVLDNAAPGSTPGELYSCRSHSEWLMHIAIRIGKLYKTNLNLQNGDFAKKSYTEQIEYFIDQLISTGILPAGLNKAHFGRFIEVYKANAKAVAGYQPYALPSPVGLTLFRAGEDDPELREQAKIADPALGWNRFTARPVEIVEVPGTHLTMLSEPHVRELADRLRECIDRASI
jgi:thioesterase domain-containing protein